MRLLVSPGIDLSCPPQIKLVELAIRYGGRKSAQCIAPLQQNGRGRPHWTASYLVGGGASNVMP